MFSPWLKFKGGKGIAVAVGCLVSTFGLTGTLIELAIFVILVAATKYVSVGSIAAAVACPFLSAYFLAGNPISVVICTIAALTVVWAHRENIKRLLAGNENKIGDKKRKAQAENEEEANKEDSEDKQQEDIESDDKDQDQEPCSNEVTSGTPETDQSASEIEESKDADQNISEIKEDKEVIQSKEAK